MPEFKNIPVKHLASDWTTELADLHEWAPMEADPHFGEPMALLKLLVTHEVRKALLKMRIPR